MKRSLITLILGLSFATSWALAQDRSETSDSDATQAVKQSEKASEILNQPAREDEELADKTEADENKNRERRRARSLRRRAAKRQSQPGLRAPQRDRRSRVQDELEGRDRGEGDPSEQEGAGENVTRRDLEAEMNDAISQMEELRQGMQRESFSQLRVFKHEMHRLEAARAEAELQFQRRQVEFQERMQELQIAITEVEAAAQEREREIHTKMMLLQHMLNPRRDAPPVARDRHRTDADRPHPARDPQARIHAELQDAVRQLRAEIAALRDEVAELSARVEER